MSDKMLEISNLGGNGQFNIIHKTGVVSEHPDGGYKELAALACFWLGKTETRRKKINNAFVFTKIQFWSKRVLLIKSLMIFKAL